VELRKVSGLADQNRPLFNEMADRSSAAAEFATQSANNRHGASVVVTASGFATSRINLMNSRAVDFAAST
jgi:hypothetical protein